jgi:hypothetical protein
VIGEGEHAVLLYNRVRGNRIPRTSGVRSSRKFDKAVRSAVSAGIMLGSRVELPRPLGGRPMRTARVAPAVATAIPHRSHRGG